MVHLDNLTTLFVGKKFYYIDQVDSTNAFAKDLIVNERPSEGSMVFANCQTAGRGQQGTTWESDAGKNITASFILYPKFLNVNQQFLLNQAISLAVLDLMRSHVNEEVKIKWPNDIYVGDKKIAGMLIENTIANDKLVNTVVGLGVNINQEMFSPEVINPTSLKIISGKNYLIEDLLKELCSTLEKRYLELRNDAFDQIKQVYQQSLYRYQEIARYRVKSGETFEAQILGTSPKGELILEKKGQLYSYVNKEVEYVLET